MAMAKVVQLIETSDYRGKGIESDPCRMVKQWYTLDGELVVEKDPFTKAEGGDEY